MVDFDRTPWFKLNANLSLYRYGYGQHPHPRSTLPILMLHGPMTSHRTWDTMATALWEQGFADVYAVDLADGLLSGSSHQSLEYLREVVATILDHYPPHTKMVLIGHSTGGVLARRFLFKSQFADRVLYLFSLASPHHRTNFTHTVYVPPEEDFNATRPTPSGVKVVKTPHIPQDTFVVNFFGNAVGPDFDGTVRGVYLPEAVNVVLPLNHTSFKQHESVIQEMIACMRGERYRVQVYLQTLHMRHPDQEGIVGPFCFEINGLRSPFDGIFQAEADHAYHFDEQNTPLAALSFPKGQALAGLIFRLKDLSRARSVRRRLFAKLLVSLGNDVTAVHEMQDNEGSKIILRVHSQRMPQLIDR